ncbi:MAG: hypothetical protein ACLQVM_10250 [Terriglobia bacterium]
MKIILFEDSEGYDQEYLLAIRNVLGGKGEAILFQRGADRSRDGTYDKHLEEDLSLPQYLNATLIVADLDLSKIPGYQGLSEGTVRKVSDSLGVPECSYARGLERDADLERSGEQRESTITVSLRNGADGFAEQVVSIAEGFAYIEQQLPHSLNTPGKKTPGKVLAMILRKPEYAEKISLYASGDQNRLASVLNVRGSLQEKSRRLTCMLGYWLWDSVLRYPGVLLNAAATSSYLNILEVAFRDDHEVRDLFKSARYQGPFAGAKEPMWWRGMIDDIVAKSDAQDGREFASKLLKKDLPRSECCEDPSKPAGYYCMLSKKPVSLDNSKGGLPWFPRGADLARVSTKKFEELGPWL